MNKKGYAGDKKEKKEIPIEKLLKKEEARIILEIILGKNEVDERELIKNLQEKGKKSRATAYRILKEWEKEGLLEGKGEKRKRGMKIQVKHGMKGLLKELYSEMEKLDKMIGKISRKKNGRGKNKVSESVEEIREKGRIDEGSMVTGIWKSNTDTDSSLLQEEGMDRNNRKRKTETTTDKVSERWKKLRKGKIEENHTKKQKKILAGIL